MRDTAGVLFELGHMVCRGTRMAEEGSRGESLRVHTRLLAPADVQPYQRDRHTRGTARCGVLATALSVWRRLGAERARSPLWPLPPACPLRELRSKEGHTRIRRGHRWRNTRSDRQNDCEVRLSRN